MSEFLNQNTDSSKKKGRKGLKIKATTAIALLVAVSLAITACQRTGSVFDDPNVQSGSEGKTGGKTDNSDNGNNTGTGKNVNDGSGNNNNPGTGKGTGNSDNTAGQDPADNNTASKGTNIGIKATGPDDNPSNHGFWAINETETGYYYEYGQPYNSSIWYGMLNLWVLHDHRLCYYDKESKESILLCTKPECEHNRDEGCVATYKGIAVYNCLLYDGMLYLYGIEENGTTVSECLWRIAPDGSYIDKIATLLEADNSAGAEIQHHRNQGAMDSAFIIHRGCAYVPYFLMIGKGSMGFKGGGLMQVNLKTGEKNTILEMKYHTDLAPSNIRGIGDYIFFTLDSSNVWDGTHRYSISRDEIEPLGSKQVYTGDNPEDLLPGIDFMMGSEKYLFNLYPDVSMPDENRMYMISVSDIDGKSLGDRNFHVDIPEHDEGIKMFKRYFCYDNRYIIIITLSRILIYGIGEDNWGKKLGETGFTLDEKNPGFSSTFDSDVDFKICNDKIYMIKTSSGDTFLTDSNTGFTVEEMMYPYKVYEMEIKDAIAGSSEWKEAFRYYRGE